MMSKSNVLGFPNKINLTTAEISTCSMKALFNFLIVVIDISQ